MKILDSIDLVTLELSDYPRKYCNKSSEKLQRICEMPITPASARKGLVWNENWNEDRIMSQSGSLRAFQTFGNALKKQFGRGDNSLLPG
jgi:hypothetical protein